MHEITRGWGVWISQQYCGLHSGPCVWIYVALTASHFVNQVSKPDISTSRFGFRGSPKVSRPPGTSDAFRKSNRNPLDIGWDFSVWIKESADRPILPSVDQPATFLKAKCVCGLLSHGLTPTPLTPGRDMKRDRLLQRKYLCVDTPKHTLTSSLIRFLSCSLNFSVSLPSAPHLSMRERP